MGSSNRLRPNVNQEDIDIISNIIIDGQDISSKEIFIKGGFDTFPELESPNLGARSHESKITFGLTQQVRWGTVVNFGLSSTHNHSGKPKDPKERPWTTDLAVNVTVPVPWFKDWGPYGALEANMKLIQNQDHMLGSLISRVLGST